MVTIDAILLGAGSGTRFSETNSAGKSSLPKQFQPLNEVPVFLHALRSLLAMDCFRSIILVVPKSYLALAGEQLRAHLPPLQASIVKVMAGGNRRQDSSRIALEALANSDSPPTRVLIHDACRPFLSEELLVQVRNCLEDRSYGAWVPVVPVVDTLKKIQNQQVTETVDRNTVHKVQTPQIFEFTVIHSLVQRVKEISELGFTDDASLCEYYGIPVGVFEGDVRNIKLTYDFEMETLGRILADARKGTQCDTESATTFTV